MISKVLYLMVLVPCQSFLMVIEIHILSVLFNILHIYSVATIMICTNMPFSTKTWLYAWMFEEISPISHGETIMHFFLVLVFFGSSLSSESSAANFVFILHVCWCSFN